MQTRLQSAIEVATGTTIGSIGSWLISYVTYSTIPNLEVATTIAVAGCTAWSLLRGYVIRRAFDKAQSKIVGSNPMSKRKRPKPPPGPPIKAHFAQGGHIPTKLYLIGECHCEELRK